MTHRPIRRALLSVHDKTGLVELARHLSGLGVELVSTGGTASALRGAGIAVTEVSEVTGAPEILGGRVKTLHPGVHGGILARRDLPEHLAALDAHGLPAIDLVVVNLYPFEATVAAGGDFAACIEQIDVGGPAMIRAAAKNHDGVAVVVDPADYATLLTELRAGRGIESGFRRRLAAKAFARTAAYDSAIASWFAGETGDAFPERMVLAGTRRQLLRYGENPHQRAAFYATGTGSLGLAAARQLQGKELSFNNLNDTDTALALVAELAEPAVAIIKHANPCGVAVGATLAEAYAKALACDPLSAFGGIVACNRPLDPVAAKEIAGIFTEVVIAPGIEPGVEEIFAAKPNLRLLALPGLPEAVAAGHDLKCLTGGFLAQDRDTARLLASEIRVVTERAPTAAELADLRFAWQVVKHVKSNAIVLARDGATVGIGMGQTSRVDSVHLAARRAAEHAGGRDCVVASDAFFPFADGLAAAIEAGAVAAIQPGGSVRDAEVIEAANRAGIAMVFTGIRHFRH
ncbi:MAG: bifunctional phosphoribosylaminoimidazolecarboxamide formyltransferase/IMP cyclohydrolase [Geminicoccaceae bacterium]